MNAIGFSWRALLQQIILVICGCICASPAQAGPHAAAGSQVLNTALASAVVDGVLVIVPSNTVSLRLDELLDVVIEPVGGARRAEGGDNDQPLAFRVTNNGSGAESFNLIVDADLSGDQFDPQTVRLYADTNHNGVFDADVDLILPPASRSEQLGAGDSAIVFVVSDMPGMLSSGDRARVSLTAASRTGYGAQGRVFVGGGDAGGDAVVGPTTARASADNYYVIGAPPASLMKSQSVRDPFGGTRAVNGAIITYTLRAHFATPVSSARISDPTPDGTTYVPGSMTLDGAPLTDGVDTDRGEFSSNTIAVSLGAITAPGDRVVAFQVRVQ